MQNHEETALRAMIVNGTGVTPAAHNLLEIKKPSGTLKVIARF